MRAGWRHQAIKLRKSRGLWTHHPAIPKARRADCRCSRAYAHDCDPWCAPGDKKRQTRYKVPANCPPFQPRRAPPEDRGHDYKMEQEKVKQICFCEIAQYAGEP